MSNFAKKKKKKKKFILMGLNLFWRPKEARSAQCWIMGFLGKPNKQTRNAQMPYTRVLVTGTQKKKKRKNRNLKQKIWWLEMASKEEISRTRPKLIFTAVLKFFSLDSVSLVLSLNCWSFQFIYLSLIFLYKNFSLSAITFHFINWVCLNLLVKSDFIKYFKDTCV